MAYKNFGVNKCPNHPSRTAVILFTHNFYTHTHTHIYIYIYSHPQTDLFRSIRTHQCG